MSFTKKRHQYIYIEETYNAILKYSILPIYYNMSHLIVTKLKKSIRKNYLYIYCFFAPTYIKFNPG